MICYAVLFFMANKNGESEDHNVVICLLQCFSSLKLLSLILILISQTYLYLHHTLAFTTLNMSIYFNDDFNLKKKLTEKRARFFQIFT